MSKMSKKHIEYDEPIIPINRDGTRAVADESSRSSKGWKFYLEVKDDLPEWWHEFNGLSKSNSLRVKYKTIEQFAKKKLSNKQERIYFIWMTGPRRIWDEEAISDDSKHRKKKRHVVPWIGDWKRRRRNGYFETENKEQIKGLTRAIKENVDSAQAIRSTAPFIVNEMMRWIRLHEKIDDLFDGKPFYDNEPPDSKGNIKRYSMYTRMHEEVEKKLSYSLRNWMRIHGVNPNNPHEMADMATLAQLAGTSAALGAVGGLTAGMGFNQIPNQNGQPSGNNLLTVGDNRVLISPDTLMLAQHLTRHSELFKKPLPPIEGKIVSQDEDERPNGKSKSNGHSKAN